MTVPPTVRETTILVVDDDLDLVVSLARILKFHRFTVYQAIGGREAVRLAGEHCPDVVMLDLRMDDMDGLEACRQIRSACPSAAVIFTTGLPVTEQQALETGAVAVMGKPLDFEQLFSTLERLGTESDRISG